MKPLGGHGETLRVIETGRLGLVVGFYRRSAETVLVALVGNGSVEELPINAIEHAGLPAPPAA